MYLRNNMRGTRAVRFMLMIGFSSESFLRLASQFYPLRSAEIEIMCYSAGTTSCPWFLNPTACLTTSNEVNIFSNPVLLLPHEYQATQR